MNLNTSNVNVNPIMMLEKMIIKQNLNTSNVNVNRKRKEERRQ